MNPSPERDEETHRQLAEAQALSSRIASVNEIATAINRPLDAKDILDIVGRKAKWVLDFDHGSVCLRAGDDDSAGGDHSKMVSLFGTAPDDAPLREEGAIWQAFRTGNPSLVQQPTGGGGPLGAFSSHLVLPLTSEGEVLGTLNFASIQERTYTQDDLRVGNMLSLLVASALRNAQRFGKLRRLNEQLDRERERSDGLLRNILPAHVTDELKEKGRVEPTYFDDATVLFTDFKDFTRSAEQLAPRLLIEELNHCFSRFDEIAEEHGLEKLKMIGDSYMCAGGIPIENDHHAIDAVDAALDMRDFMVKRTRVPGRSEATSWSIRIGIHTGPLVAGVIGRRKFAYDVWGDTVNVAARMESSGVRDKVNVSRATYEQVKDHFRCERRDRVKVKHKGSVEMYFVEHECY